MDPKALKKRTGPTWQAFLKERIDAAPFVPYDLDFDRDNPGMAAHLSRKAYFDYYGHKGNGEFWTRLSMSLKPKVIVEIGTAFGIRTNLLGKLNPQAELISFDLLSPYPLNDLRVETGYIARLNKTPFRFINTRALGVKYSPIKTNLFFIDGDHEETSVRMDTMFAWENRDPERFCIVWDDYGLPGVGSAVRGLCERELIPWDVGDGMAWVGSEDWLR